MVLVSLVIILMHWPMPFAGSAQLPTSASSSPAASPQPGLQRPSAAPSPTPQSTANPGDAQETRAEADCSKARDARSIRGEDPTTITWVNKSSTTIKVYWIDYDGKRVFYESIAKGEIFVQRTWESHPWILLDSSGACRGFTVAVRNASTYDVH